MIQQSEKKNVIKISKFAVTAIPSPVDTLSQLFEDFLTNKQAENFGEIRRRLANVPATRIPGSIDDKICQNLSAVLNLFTEASLDEKQKLKINETLNIAFGTWPESRKLPHVFARALMCHLHAEFKYHLRTRDFRGTAHRCRKEWEELLDSHLLSAAQRKVIHTYVKDCYTWLGEHSFDRNKHIVARKWFKLSEAAALLSDDISGSATSAYSIAQTYEAQRGGRSRSIPHYLSAYHRLSAERANLFLSDHREPSEFVRDRLLRVALNLRSFELPKKYSASVELGIAFLAPLYQELADPSPSLSCDFYIAKAESSLRQKRPLTGFFDLERAVSLLDEYSDPLSVRELLACLNALTLQEPKFAFRSIQLVGKILDVPIDNIVHMLLRSAKDAVNDQNDRFAILIRQRVVRQALKRKTIKPRVAAEAMVDCAAAYYQLGNFAKSNRMMQKALMLFPPDSKAAAKFHLEARKTHIERMQVSYEPETSITAELKNQHNLILATSTSTRQQIKSLLKIGYSELRNDDLLNAATTVKDLRTVATTLNRRTPRGVALAATINRLAARIKIREGDPDGAEYYFKKALRRKAAIEETHWNELVRLLRQGAHFFLSRYQITSESRYLSIALRLSVELVELRDARGQNKEESLIRDLKLQATLLGRSERFSEAAICRKRAKKIKKTVRSNYRRDEEGPGLEGAA